MRERIAVIEKQLDDTSNGEEIEEQVVSEEELVGSNAEEVSEQESLSVTERSSGDEEVPQIYRNVVTHTTYNIK